MIVASCQCEPNQTADAPPQVQIKSTGDAGASEERAAA